MGRVGDALVALAGPAMNFLLAFVTALLTPVAFHFSEEIGRLLQLGVGLNILLGLFNLLPIPPFDGEPDFGCSRSRSAAALRLPRRPEHFSDRLHALFVSGAFGYLQSFAFGVAWLLVDVSGVLWSPILG